MSDGVCNASLRTIARRLGLNEATAQRHIKVLVGPVNGEGYLKDLTPGLRKRPHTYADTGKAMLRVAVTATVAENNSLGEAVAEGNSAVAQSNKSVAESRLKKEIERNIKKASSRETSTTIGAANPGTRDDDISLPLELLKSVGVDSQMRLRLSSLSHMTPDYVRGHIGAWRGQQAEAQRRGGKVPGVGVLVNRLKENEPVPVLSEPAMPANGLSEWQRNAARATSGYRRAGQRQAGA
jgi:hypothetical protein